MTEFLKLLWLDDLRDPEEYIGAIYGFHLWCKTAAQAILALETMEFDEVSLDHDLGLVGPNGENPGDGYDVLLWIESKVRLEGWKPPVMKVHSANPVAVERMEAAIQSILTSYYS